MKVLVTARAFWVSGQSSQAALEHAGAEVIHSPEAGPLPEAELIPLLQGCHAVIPSSDPYNARVFDSCPDLQLVARCGVGIDKVDLEAATRFGVVITNTPGAMTDAVADYAFALMLSLARRLPEGVAMMESGDWGELPGVGMRGQTLGLAGFGMIGQAVARRAAGFEMRILAFDPLQATLAQPPGLPEVEFVPLETLLSESDFVSIHAPSLPETREMFNAERFRLMKPTAMLINTARGALVDEAALIEALETGVIAGAAIDVYQQEPLPADHPLRHTRNLLATPHNAFNTTEAAEAMSRMSAESCLSLIHGNQPERVCNPEVWNSPALRWRREHR